MILCMSMLSVYVSIFFYNSVDLSPLFPVLSQPTSLSIFSFKEQTECLLIFSIAFADLFLRPDVVYPRKHFMCAGEECV